MDTTSLNPRAIRTKLPPVKVTRVLIDLLVSQAEAMSLKQAITGWVLDLTDVTDYDLTLADDLRRAALNLSKRGLMAVAIVHPDLFARSVLGRIDASPVKLKAFSTAVAAEQWFRL